MQPLTEYVLDASALLALINGEPGADKVRPLMADCIISAVNFCETVHRLRRRGLPVETVRATLTPLVAVPVPFDEPMAYVAASIHEGISCVSMRKPFRPAWPREPSGSLALPSSRGTTARYRTAALCGSALSPTSESSFVPTR